MASDKREKALDKDLSSWQMFKAGFAGDSSAQMKRKNEMMDENAALAIQNAPMQKAIKKRVYGE